MRREHDRPHKPRKDLVAGYERVNTRVLFEFRKSFMEVLSDLLMRDRLAIAEAAERLGITRNQLYRFARYKGVEVRTEVVFVDVLAPQIEAGLAVFEGPARYWQEQALKGRREQFAEWTRPASPAPSDDTEPEGSEGVSDGAG